MATEYRFQKTITVTVLMADNGENFEGEPVTWSNPEEQLQSAKEFRDDAVTVFADPEEWVDIEEGEWLDARKAKA